MRDRRGTARGLLGRLYRFFEAKTASSIVRSWSRKSRTARTDLLKGKDVLLFPYGTPACRLQHLVLAEHLKQLGVWSVVLADPLDLGPVGPESLAGSKPDEPRVSFSSMKLFEEAVLRECQGDNVLARGAIDEFVRYCPVDAFFGEFHVSPLFFHRLQHARDRAEDLVGNLAGLVVADRAYTTNAGLLGAAWRAKKPVFVFNPDGNWHRVSSLHSMRDKGFDISEIFHRLQESKDMLVEAESFLERRFSGRLADRDTSVAFSETAEGHPARKKKVLFLHVFRDSNLVPLSESEVGYSIFSSFFDWADFCFAAIAERPDDWYIKVHPSARLYEGETEIVRRLLKKHGLSHNLIDDCPPSLHILRNRWPIFTHSGTIAIEAAVFGYRANVASSFLPAALCRASVTKADLLGYLQEPADEEPLRIEEELVPVAKVLLHQMIAPNVPSLAPRAGQPNKKSELVFFFSLVSQFLSLVSRYLRSGVQGELRVIALQLKRDIAIGPNSD